MAVKEIFKLFYKYSWVILAMIIFSSYFIGATETDSDPPPAKGEKRFVRSFYSLRSLAVNELSIYKVLMEQLTLLSVYLNPEITSSALIPYLGDYAGGPGRISGQFQDELEFGNIVASHPLLAARLIYRYVAYLKPLITNSLDIVETTELKSISDDVGLAFGWPTQADVNDSWESLLRLHHVHDLNVEEIVRGTVFSSEISAELNAKHCTEVGKYAVKDGFYALAIDWLETAKILVEQKYDKSVELQEIEESLLEAFMAHDLEWDTASPTDAMLFTKKLITRPESNLRVKRRTYLHNVFKGQRGSNFNHISFWGLCSGDDFRTDEERMYLFCWYDRESHPYWFINPLKIERISWYPDAVQVYEVLSNSTISKLIDAGIPHLIKSQVHMPDGSQKHSKHRTSSTAWLNEFKYPELMHIPRRIELVTGLVIAPINSSEMLQIAAYTFGNRYEIHKDNLGEDKDQESIEIGDRIATFMIYLSEVEKGGYTAFAQAGIGVRPVKGSAVFWYNLNRNGEPDDSSYHGGCPVIMGNKWSELFPTEIGNDCDTEFCYEYALIANKWIRSHAQMFARTCSLMPDE